jgi:hypothetical protein
MGNIVLYRRGRVRRRPCDGNEPKIEPDAASDSAPLAKAESARRNGALARGPVTPEGKARSAMNATRHGLCARTMVSGDEGEVGELAALRAALLARWQPMGAAEAHLVEELVFAAWRQVRLRAVEDAVVARAERGRCYRPPCRRSPP